jgi:tRNA A37 threonylcarbamoyladenosine dehydratase
MAQTSTIGKFKAESLKSRILDINPSAEVYTLLEFVQPDNAATFLTSARTDAPSAVLQGLYDYVIDAVDSSADKAAIIDACVRSGTPVVTCGGVGGLTDQAEGDSLLYRVRRTLRREYGYPSYKEKEETAEEQLVASRKKSNNVRRVRKWGILAVHTLPTGTSRTPLRSHQAESIGQTSDYSQSQSDKEEQELEACSVSR